MLPDRHSIDGAARIASYDSGGFQLATFATWNVGQLVGTLIVRSSTIANVGVIRALASNRRQPPSVYVIPLAPGGLPKYK